MLEHHKDDFDLQRWLQGAHRHPIAVFFAHPDIERSRANRHVRDSVKDLPHVLVNDLYEHYPNLMIDINREQTIAKHARLLVFLHPFYWYSSPAIIKQWFDMVLERGWAYGEGGDALRGREMMIVTTTGGPKQAYESSGYNRFTITEFLRPQEQTAHLCGMRFLAPRVLHNARGAAQTEIETFGQDLKSLFEAYETAGNP